MLEDLRGRNKSALPDKQLLPPLDPASDRSGLRYICVCIGLLDCRKSINKDLGQRYMPP